MSYHIPVLPHIACSYQHILVLTSALSFQMIFVFNKEVEHIHVYVYDDAALSRVDLAVQSMLEDWVKSSCPLNTREGTTPFTLTTFPSGWYLTLR